MMFLFSDSIVFVSPGFGSMSVREINVFFEDFFQVSNNCVSDPMVWCQNFNCVNLFVLGDCVWGWGALVPILSVGCVD